MGKRHVCLTPSRWAKVGEVFECPCGQRFELRPSPHVDVFITSWVPVLDRWSRRLWRAVKMR